jgi:hypothetical protein
MPNSPRFFDFFLKEELMGDGHEDTSAEWVGGWSVDTSLAHVFMPR